MASKLKISLSEQPDLLNQLEKAMQPVFKTNHVAALGFLGIKDSGFLEQLLEGFEGGIDMGSDLYLVPEESPTGKLMGQASGWFSHGGIDQRKKIYVRQKGENPLQFLNMSATEYNSFVHELTHLGHSVLKDLLRENTSGIPELTTTRDPKMINMVSSAMDKDAAKSFYESDSIDHLGNPIEGMVKSYRDFPEGKQDLWKRKGLGPPYMIKAEQYPNEVANIIARLYGGDDGSMFTENLTFLNSYDSTRSASGYDRFPKDDLARFNAAKYNERIKTTAGYTSQGKYQSMGFYGKYRSNNPKKIIERGVKDGKYMGDEWGIDTYDTADFYPSDKHFIQDLRRQNKMLNAVSKKVLDKVKALPPRKYVYPGQAEQPFISEKSAKRSGLGHTWDKFVDTVVGKPLEAMGFNPRYYTEEKGFWKKGGRIGSLDIQMKALKVG